MFTTTMRRTMGAALAALMVAGIAAAPAAEARTTSPVIKSWRVSASSHVAIAAGPTAIWVANADEYHNATIYRVNPSNNLITQVTTLRFPIGDLAVGFGSEWVSDYFGNAVYRLGPTGGVQARIPVGLQPQWIHMAFGSVWVANHHDGSLSRIDPTSNTVTATAAIGEPGRFRNGPQDITDDGSKLFAVSSNLPQLQTVDPATNAVSTASGPNGEDGFCGRLVFAGGQLWSVDNCSQTTFLLGTDGTINRAIMPASGFPTDVTVLGPDVWLSVDYGTNPTNGFGMDGTLERRDAATGDELATVPLGGDIQTVTAGFGDLWVWDAAANQVRRVQA